MFILSVILRGSRVSRPSSEDRRHDLLGSQFFSGSSFKADHPILSRSDTEQCDPVYLANSAGKLIQK
jgi:hypothetical protein